MARYVGVKNNRICIVSDKRFSNGGMEIIEVSSELSDLSQSDLLTCCVVRDGKIQCKQSKKLAKEMKVALVGNWKMRCGIAEYNQSLWSEVVKHVGDFKLFVEKNEFPMGDLYQLGNQIISDQQVSVCWERGKSLQQLVKEIKAYAPDIIWISHEFGLFANAAYWLSMMSGLSDYRVITTMHSVFHHRDKTIMEAAMPEIVVHLEGGRKVLKEEKGVLGKVSVISHGCYEFDGERLWNAYKSSHTFTQIGFGFRYKNFAHSIQATAILKAKYPDVFFTALFSESPYNQVEHRIYYNELMQMVEDLGLSENVAIIRGFQSDAVLDSFLRTNQAAIFPYVSQEGHQVFGASGQARLAMSRGLPVITSSIPHFSDLPTIKADTPEEIAGELDRLFSEPKAKEKQLQKQIGYILENTWEKTALRYIKLFEGCCE